MAIGLIVLAIILALAVLPQMWVRRVIDAHSQERADFPGTGGEFARHLLDEMKLGHVGVEQTDMGDHYDPMSKTVRLLPQHYGTRSLSAVTIAAHEVGHAMQDATDYAPLRARTRMAARARSIEIIGTVLILASPLMVLVTKSPLLMFAQVGGGMLVLGFTILIHAVTLPVEFDASFGRALPVLKAGSYIGDRDMASAKSILRAAALTYVAAAAMSLLDVARWIRILRF